MKHSNACRPISSPELERRWAAVRSAMSQTGIDALLMQSNNDYQGGYVKWFTDVPAVNGIHTTVFFPANDLMTVVSHGGVNDGPPHADGPWRGVGHLITRPNFAAAHYTRHYQSDAILKLLASRAGATIGLIGSSMMSGAFLQALIENIGLGVKFVDATDIIDAIKAIKSDEELILVRECAALQDEVLAAVAAALRPGMHVFELTAIAQKVGQDLGSENGLFMATARPVGKPGPKQLRHFQNEQLQAGDVFDILIENNGPGGYYCEIARTFVLGKATTEMIEAFTFTQEAQKRTLDLCRPGAEPAEIIRKHNEFMRDNGYPEEARLLGHGQGYDLVERPLFLANETIKLRANMNIVVHLGIQVQDAVVGVCDNYIVGNDGVGSCLHRTAQKIFELWD